MKPLHIRFELSSPLAAFDKRPSYLDGLLSGVYGEVLLSHARECGFDDPFEEALDLSSFLDSVEIGGERVWKASRLFANWSGPLHWWTMTRKTDPLNYKWAQEENLVRSRRSSVDLGSSQEKNFFWYLPIRMASHVDAWCIGDIDELRKLLSSVRSIGKYRNSGFGVVSNVQVEEDEVANTKWRWRPLPYADEAKNEQDPKVTYTPSFEAVAPPYWNKLTQKKCVIPIIF